MYNRGDAWASEVQNRLHGCIHLVAAEAIYHVNCYCLIKRTLHQQQRFLVGPRTRECQWLESKTDAELYTLTELHAKMVKLSGGSDIYTLKRLKQKLNEHYEDFIFFVEVEGCGTFFML